jgi:enoyl-[acyl-carrier protein] reductase II
METNRICDLLGIRYPIIQAPMNWVSGVKLAAAVSNGGGLGTLGPNAGETERTRDPAVRAQGVQKRIREMRRLTKKPFALNIPVGFTEHERLHSEKMVQTALEEGLPVAIVSVGSPNVYTDVLKKGGIKVLHAVSTKAHALKAEETGVDAVICEGFEAGGHKGFTELTTFVLVPMVADAVKVPVVAGGGIGDVRGLMAVLMLGADAAYMGTRFMMAAESEAHARVKEMLLKGDDVCTVSLRKQKMLARDFRNRFAEVYSDLYESGASDDSLNAFLSDHSQYHSQHLGEADEAEICCGQVAGLINGIERAGDIIAKMVAEAALQIETLKEKGKPFTSKR